LNQRISIVGGGLTGLSLAIALRKHGIPTTLHEAADYPRHRVCGEFISGVSEQTLDTLGISSCLEDAKKHTSMNWFSGDKLIRHGRLNKPAMAISRYLLDERLSEKAKAVGVDLRTKSRISVSSGTPGFVKTTGRVPTRGKWIGLKAHVKGLGTTANLEMHSGPIGYLGITPVEDDWFNVCGLFRIDRQLEARHEALIPAYLEKNGNHLLAANVAQAEWRDSSFSSIAGIGLGRQPISPGILSLGDSHSMIPPFTGNGMSMAFQSAETALPLLISYAKHGHDWETVCQSTERELQKRFRKRMTASLFLHPFLFQTATRHLLKYAPLNPVLSLIR
jgi:2-polyprenyl-6-methoxyphenol hydroxylase-like FAD-dependent oxidoreductase